MVTLTETQILEPIGSYAVCEPIEDVGSTIALPADALKKMRAEGCFRARILRIGRGKRHNMTNEFVPTERKVGEVVYLMSSLHEFKENGKTLLLIDESQIYGVERIDPHMED